MNEELFILLSSLFGVSLFLVVLFSYTCLGKDDSSCTHKKTKD